MAETPKIAMVAAEAVPFAKVGGLADVIGALPVELKNLGAAVSVIIPRYTFIDLEKFGFVPYELPELRYVRLGFESIPFDVHVGSLPGSDGSRPGSSRPWPIWPHAAARSWSAAS